MEESKRLAVADAALRLATATANDLVALAFMAPEEATKLAGLDLTMLSSFERTAQGGTKVVVLDRVAALRAAYDCLERTTTGDELTDLMRALGGFEGGAEGED